LPPSGGRRTDTISARDRLRVMGCRRDHVGGATGVPQKAADFAAPPQSAALGQLRKSATRLGSDVGITGCIAQNGDVRVWARTNIAIPERLAARRLPWKYLLQLIAAYECGSNKPFLIGSATTWSVRRKIPAPAIASLSNMSALSALIGPLTSIRISLPFTRNGHVAAPGRWLTVRHECRARSEGRIGRPCRAR
jgi:hypothetical protein